MTSLSETLAQLQAITAINLKGMPLPAVLRELLSSPSIEASFFLGQVLRFASSNLQLELTPSELELIVAQQLQSITQITTFALAYPHVKKSHRAAAQWRESFLRERSQGMFEKFNEWVVTHNPNETIFRAFVQLLICELPLFLKAESIDPSQKEFESYLMWLSYFEVKDRAEHLAVCQTVKLIKDARLMNTPDYEHKGHLMLRRVIELLGQEERRRGSLYMLFDPFSIREKDIEYFCNVYEHLLEDLDERYLCNIFQSLTHGGINKEILFLIQMVSHLLQNGEQFYTLRYVYQHFVLPVLACQFKSHRKLHHDIFTLVLFYVAGFLTHCKLDETAIACLTAHLDALEPKAQPEWAELALLACKDDLQLREATKQTLAGLGLGHVSEAALNKSIEKNKRVWKVTMRNGRKLKKYPEIDSIRFRGLINRCNECYIISTVQALFATEELPLMVDRLRGTAKKGKLTVFDEIRRIFDSLAKREEKGTIASLKARGPQLFRTSNNQEDVQEYLLSLFDMLEQELRLTPQGLSLFEELLKIEYSGRFICQTCGESWEKERTEQTYIYSFRHNEVFQFQGQEKMEGYPCRKCKKEDLVQQTTITNQPKLLILHINRFSHQGGVSKKNLGNKPIKRTLGNYRLAGFISHRGANISAGHYLFYGRVGPERWAIFDDCRVAEFSVGEEEEFEREFRSENTPYILFYRLAK